MSGAVVPTVRVQAEPFDLAAETAALTAGRADVGGLQASSGCAGRMTGWPRWCWNTTPA